MGKGEKRGVKKTMEGAGSQLVRREYAGLFPYCPAPCVLRELEELYANRLISAPPELGSSDEYSDWISRFMADIGRADLVLVVLSAWYCMRELFAPVQQKPGGARQINATHGAARRRPIAAPCQ